MKASVAMGVLSILSVMAFAGAAAAAEWHVAPDGKPTGDGSATKPWNLATALAQPAAVQPGDTIWLHAGAYTGATRTTFSSKLKGTAEKPIVVRPAAGEHVKIMPTLTIAEGEYAWFRDFEVMNPDTKEYGRVEHGRLPAVWLAGGKGIKLINLVIHDGGQGIGAWQPAVDAEIYGCILFNNGWAGSNQGHAIYTQNKDGAKRIEDNIMFNQLGTGYGVHCYGSKNAYVNNFYFAGNVAFNNQGNNILIGGGRPSAGIVAEHNFAWAGNGVRIGYTAHNIDVALRDNYFATKFSFNNWDKGVVEGNTIINAGTVAQLDARQLDALPKYTWNKNTYFSATGAEKPFLLLGPAKTPNVSYGLVGWQKATGCDMDSTCAPAAPTGVKVFVRPNRYEPGRATVIVYNWDKRGTVAVDLGDLLKDGDAFEVRDVQDFLGKPVFTGAYRGGKIELPMVLTEVMQPVTKQTFTHTAAEFNVFVVRKVEAADAGGEK